MSSIIEDSIARVRAICVALPNAAEAGRVASGVGRMDGTRVVTFTVSRRIFARMFVVSQRDGEIVVLWIRARPEERAALLASGHPFMAAGQREVAVVLDNATDWSEVAELVTESYLVIAPKKLAADAEAAVRARSARA